MTYHFSKTLALGMDEAIVRVTDELKKEGFGILTEIDVQKTLKAKIDVDFRPYRILGACNPGFAHKALLAEDKIGTMLPCNVIVQEHTPGKVEVSAAEDGLVIDGKKVRSDGNFAPHVPSKDGEVSRPPRLH